MPETGRRDLVVRPNAPWVHTIDYEGFDFTGATFSAQFRDRKNGGNLRADLGTVASVGTEGITLTGVTETDGIPTSHLSMRLNEATTEGWITSPSVESEAGEDGTIYWQLQITPSGGVKFNALEGEVTVKAGAHE